MRSLIIPPGLRRGETRTLAGHCLGCLSLTIVLLVKDVTEQSPGLLSVFMSFPDKHQVRFEDIARLRSLLEGGNDRLLSPWPALYTGEREYWLLGDGESRED